MEQFVKALTEINNSVNNFVWVTIGLVLLIGTGILMTCCTKFFQISHLGHWWRHTIGSVFKGTVVPQKRRIKSRFPSFRRCVRHSPPQSAQVI